LVSELHSVMGLASQLPQQLAKSRLPGTRGQQVPLGGHLRPAAVPVRRGSPEPRDSQPEQEPRAQVQPEMSVAVLEAEDFARAKSMQARVNIGRH
jgi:hypothetical protein